MACRKALLRRAGKKSPTSRRHVKESPAMKSRHAKESPTTCRQQKPCCKQATEALLRAGTSSQALLRAGNSSKPCYEKQAPRRKSCCEKQARQRKPCCEQAPQVKPCCEQAIQASPAMKSRHLEKPYDA